MDKKMDWVNEEMWEDYTKRVSIEIGPMEFHRTMFGRMLKAVECRNTEFLHGDMLVFNPEYPGELDFETEYEVQSFVEKYRLEELVQTYIQRSRLKEAQRRQEIMDILENYCSTSERRKMAAIASIALEYGIPFGVVSPVVTLEEVKEIFEDSDILEI